VDGDYEPEEPPRRPTKRPRTVSYFTRFIWYLPCALLIGNRQHWRLIRPVSLTPAPVPVALDRPVVLNHSQGSLTLHRVHVNDPALNSQQEPHPLHVNAQMTLNGL
jgi:hypothetical protein